MLKCLVIITYMSILNTIFSLIFPVNCVSCGKNDTYLCLDCLSSCPPAERESENWIFPMYDYRNKNIKKCIWLFKYKNKKSIASIFADTMYPRILEEISERKLIENFKNPILIPIPLSKKRFRERGFNQAELLCEEIVKLDKKENLELLNNALIRTVDKEHQAKIEDRKKRIANIIGCFKVINENLINGKNIILIDDVTTTGATLSEAKKILKGAGARKVIAFTIAH